MIVDCRPHPQSTCDECGAAIYARERSCRCVSVSVKSDLLRARKTTSPNSTFKKAAELVVDNRG